MTRSVIQSLHQSYKLGSLDAGPVKDQLVSSAENLLWNLGKTFTYSVCPKVIKDFIVSCQNRILNVIPGPLIQLGNMVGFPTVISILKILYNCYTNGVTLYCAFKEVMNAIGSALVASAAVSAGAYVGAAVGGFVGGPIGAGIGGFVGSVIGACFGSSIWEWILKALQCVVKLIKQLWEKFCSV